MTADDPSPDRRGCVLLANGLLIAMGLGVLGMHAAWIPDLVRRGHPPGMDVAPLGAWISAIVTVLVAIPLAIAGFSRRTVPRALRRVELALVVLMLAGAAAELALVRVAER